MARALVGKRKYGANLRGFGRAYDLSDCASEEMYVILERVVGHIGQQAESHALAFDRFGLGV